MIAQVLKILFYLNYSVVDIKLELKCLMCLREFRILGQQQDVTELCGRVLEGHEGQM